jgi:hypothetical protein
MSDPLPTENTRPLDGPTDPERDAKIEHLLLVGLDHYFAAEYEHAINVWTRALFLDRSHARARAYIERARSALAERLRESEEILRNGVAAFERGDGEEARRLLQTAISRGAPSEEALAVLDRLDRLEYTRAPSAPMNASRAVRTQAIPAGVAPGGSTAPRLRTWLGVLVVLAAAGIAAAWSYPDWRSLVSQADPVSVAAPKVAGNGGLPLPRRGEELLTRARELQATGHLKEALAALELVRPTDLQKQDADRLRAAIQKELLSLSHP